MIHIIVKRKKMQKSNRKQVHISCPIFTFRHKKKFALQQLTELLTSQIINTISRGERI